MGKCDMIKDLVEKNNGILHVSELNELGIHRQYVKILEEEGYLIKVAKGLYVRYDADINEFYINGERFKTGIYSHNTALYFYNLTDRTPINLDMTFPSNVRISDDFIESHYIKKELHELGLVTKTLEDGTSIRIYDMERTMCDIIRDRNKLDPQVFNSAMKEYFKSKNRNLNLLYKYAKTFNIEKILKKYMEVLD